MSLVSILNSRNTSIASSDETWRNFLKDFKSSLLKTGISVPVTDYQQRVFKHRLKDFLKEISVSQELTWVVVWLNNMESALNFVNKSYLVIPDYSEVNRIRKLYEASHPSA